MHIFMSCCQLEGAGNGQAVVGLFPAETLNNFNADVVKTKHLWFQGPVVG